jgi:hypothetical protein
LAVWGHWAGWVVMPSASPQLPLCRGARQGPTRQVIMLWAGWVDDEDEVGARSCLHGIIGRMGWSNHACCLNHLCGLGADEFAEYEKRVCPGWRGIDHVRLHRYNGGCAFCRGRADTGRERDDG